jgi:hypothetical protein
MSFIMKFMKWELILAIVAASLVVFLLFFGGVEVTTATIWDDTKPLQEVRPSQMKRLHQGPITIYYEKNQFLAKEVAAALSQSWLLIENRLGLRLGSFGVTLVEASEEQVGGFYIKQEGGLLLRPAPPFPQLVTPSTRNFRETDPSFRVGVYWAMPHEAVHNIVHLEFDPQARGLEEGLAEYVGYIITKQFDSEALKLMLEKRKEQVQQVLQSRESPIYDLTQEFPGHFKLFTSQQILSISGFTPTEVAGYGVALAFWLQIAQKHGEGVIKTFWQRLSQRGFPSAKEAAQILSELTGEDIWAKLQKMDLHEVLRILEQAVGP